MKLGAAPARNPQISELLVSELRLAAELDPARLGVRAADRRPLLDLTPLQLRRDAEYCERPLGEVRNHIDDGLGDRAKN